MTHTPLTVYALCLSTLQIRFNAVLPPDVLNKTIMAGVCRTADVLCSFSLLSRLSPVTHSVGRKN